ncbi:hypothetical protein [Bradyrhizobium sp. JYMT SZCCT0428]|uniref:hypothetical protein n=1 Tax=Bradyrhizobium sp. JYMT SZCCT0428 TaxID=2807673 RepID=UPI001BAB4A8D|nr:hypothetical protein [Bradyrhizobium sp. JYMT SZCCT0428]MBR1153738.1 hypothetical protein [Bradyrhizobium sp. JYMT SZCCT0428]
MTTEQFAYTLLSIEGKDKANTLMQISNSYIYSIARGGYEAGYDVYDQIAKAGRLITDQVPAEKAGILGIKSFNQKRHPKNTKGRVLPDLRRGPHTEDLQA